MKNNDPLLYLENEDLRVGISKTGAEMRLLYNKKHGFHVLKKEEDPTWDGCAPILFPICGRLWEQTTIVNGKPYTLGIHGFTDASEFTVTEKSDTHIVLTLTDSEEILQGSYPFPFTLNVTYTLRENVLTNRVSVENRGGSEMPFAIGFHPGFSLALDGAEDSADAYLEFPESAHLQAWRMTYSGYLLGGTEPYPLCEGNLLPIKHELFRGGACVFLENTEGAVTLRSHSTDRRVRVDYEGIPFLGLWRPDDERTTFLCIEPWTGSPDYEGKITPLSQKRDMFLLPPEASRSFEYHITVL